MERQPGEGLRGRGRGEGVIEVVSAGKGFGSGSSEARGHPSVVADVGAKALPTPHLLHGVISLSGVVRARDDHWSYATLVVFGRSVLRVRV